MAYQAEKPRHTYVAHPLPDAGLVRLPSILAIYPISRTGLYNKINAGEFPAPVKLGPRTSAWRVEDVREALAKLGVAA
mgnify:CR=1 FL=1